VAGHAICEHRGSEILDQLIPSSESRQITSIYINTTSFDGVISSETSVCAGMKEMALDVLLSFFRDLRGISSMCYMYKDKQAPFPLASIH
jgi:hypothetical protein